MPVLLAAVLVTLPCATQAELPDDDTELTEPAEPDDELAPAKPRHADKSIHAAIESTIASLATMAGCVVAGGSAAGVFSVVTGGVCGCASAWYLDAVLRGCGSPGLTPDVALIVALMVGGTIAASILGVLAAVLPLPLPLVEWAVFTALMAVRAKKPQAAIASSAVGLGAAGLSTAMLIAAAAVPVVAAGMLYGLTVYLGSLPVVADAVQYAIVGGVTTASGLLLFGALVVAGLGILVLRPAAVSLWAREEH